MKLEDISEFFETVIYTEANQKIKEGFIVHKIAPSKIKTSEGFEECRQLYILTKGRLIK